MRRSLQLAKGVAGREGPSRRRYEMSESTRSAPLLESIQTHFSPNETVFPTYLRCQDREQVVRGIVPEGVYMVCSSVYFRY